MTETKSFSNYGFTADYPAKWKAKADPLSRRDKGTVLFRSPRGTEIFISWGPLEEAKETYASPKEQADGALEKLKKDKRVKETELVESKPMRVNFHKAHFSHIKITQVFSVLFFMKKTLHNEIRSLHLYCGRSGRYFVIYGMTTPENSQKHKAVFEDMLKSFKCHGLQKQPATKTA